MIRGLRFVFTAAVSALMLVGATMVPSAATPPEQGFEIVKVCPTAGDPAACDIVSSTPFHRLGGGPDQLRRPGAAGDAVLPGDRPGDPDRADGRGLVWVRGQIRFIGEAGKFTLRQGEGSLAGLHATGTIAYTGTTRDGRSAFTLTGQYHVDPQ